MVFQNIFLKHFKYFRVKIYFGGGLVSYGLTFRVTVSRYDIKLSLWVLRINVVFGKLITIFLTTVNLAYLLKSSSVKWKYCSTGISLLWFRNLIQYP